MPQKKQPGSLKKSETAKPVLKFLIIVRHGEYDDDYNLSPNGKKQMQNLSRQLQRLVDGHSILLLSSIAKRASQSTEEISQILGVPFEEHDILWSENKHPENIAGLLQLIRARQHEADVMILTTHLEYAELFPAYFAREELNHELKNAYDYTPGKGEACIIDCIGKNFHLLS